MDYMRTTGLPLEIWNEVCKHLSIRGLANLDQLNKDLHQVASNPNLSLLSRKVHEKYVEVVHANLQQLWNFPEANFYVGDNNTLKRISNWNSIERMLNWRDGDDANSVYEAVEWTMREALFLVTQKIYLKVTDQSDAWFFDPEAYWSGKYPVNLVACRLKNSEQFRSLDEVLMDSFAKPIFFGSCIDNKGEVIQGGITKCHHNLHILEPIPGGRFHWALVEPKS